ncbi:uncharacterized protein PV06_08453 [Exophiala oligosperma]|uniref:G-protein coupled receptors family 2 profile 2 domain-containing protein n=1 Tax=Exophiala oligosperma TaxID=215243 RepID=A0A0D2AIB6_9EURO|nr:uncharacterized protein PV06_08453 [Exophiala oligosperma]KIW39881.1 hypothetical protein PV06_08453 [Exophiala oligosperma]
MAFSNSEMRAFDTAEKVASVFSVLGAIFIIFTFLLDDRFRKAINRMVFFACWGNLFSNVATLISRSGINLGVDTALCQFQGFLIQWFMPADALWTFAMACNVYLSFFHRYDATKLRALEWRYLVACYGIPFVPALVFLFIETEKKGKLYGDAVLWCWVSESWNALRIATFYGPVWLVILVTVFIYIKVGMVVFRWRKKLMSMDQSNSRGAMGGVAARKDVSLQREYSMNDMPQQQQQRYEVRTHSQAPDFPEHKHQQVLNSPQNTTSFMEDSLRSPNSLKSPTHARYPSVDESYPEERRTTVVADQPSVKVVDANKAALSYCKTAMLFFIALIVVWVPSTINRVYTLAKPTDPQFGLEFASGLVLPLQGFWNTIIYIMTSLPACQALLADIVGAHRRGGGRGGYSGDSQMRSGSLGGSSRNAAYLHHHTLPSTDNDNENRADIMVSYDGKNRIVRHHSRIVSGDANSASGIISHDYMPHAR